MNIDQTHKAIYVSPKDSREAVVSAFTQVYGFKPTFDLVFVDPQPNEFNGLYYGSLHCETEENDYVIDLDGFEDPDAMIDWIVDEMQLPIDLVRRSPSEEEMDEAWERTLKRLGMTGEEFLEKFKRDLDDLE